MERMLAPSRVSLQYADEQRKAWLAALEATSSGQSYSIGGRTLTRQDIPAINDQIARWTDTVKAIDARQRGRVRKMHARGSYATPGSGAGNLYPQELWGDWRT